MDVCGAIHVRCKRWQKPDCYPLSHLPACALASCWENYPPTASVVVRRLMPTMPALCICQVQVQWEMMACRDVVVSGDGKV